MADDVIKGFYGYPAQPVSLGEVIREAAIKINSSAVVSLKTWEDCRVGGKVIINEICREIDSAKFFCADLTGINANVMFELGYAIARNKRIWLTIDGTFSDARKDFEQLRILTTVGYRHSVNSGLLVNEFYKDLPYEDLQTTVFDSQIRPHIAADAKVYLVYLKSRYETEASMKISARIQQAPIPQIVDDPSESAIQTLAWYGSKLSAAAAVVCHLESPERLDSKVQIARRALAAGMAFGFDKPLLMLTEGNFLTPLDYRDLLRHYQTAAEAKGYLDSWLEPLEPAWKESIESRTRHIKNVHLASELKNLQLGEYIAENEADTINEYFVETAAYEAALAGKQSIFVGRKGSGKSANFLALFSAFQSDARNFVCVVKPIAYELEGIVSLLQNYKEKDEKSYAVESLWKFLLITEIADSVARTIEERPAWSLDEDENTLLDVLNANGGYLRKEFSVRLENCVAELTEQASHAKVDDRRRQDSRLGISEAVHESVLGELRRALGRVLWNKKRVAVLIDNLDKAWDKQTDISSYSGLLLGLLAAINRLTADFQRSANKLDPINVSVAMFLRSDIFYHVMSAAREPDKIGHTLLTWDDNQLLLRVLEQRFVKFHANSISSEEVWNKYFCKMVQDTPTPKYLVERSLKRPRDLLYFVKAAMENAVNRGHGHVEESDIFQAEKQYSQFALSTVVVENFVALPEIENILYEFAGSNEVVTLQEITNCIGRAKVQSSSLENIITQLCLASFFGVEIGYNTFRFAEDMPEYKKLNVLASKFQQLSNSAPRYQINTAFRAYLETKEQ